MKGDGFYIYHRDSGIRTVLTTESQEKLRTKWWLDDNKGICTISVVSRTKQCAFLYKIGDNKYRYYYKNGKVAFTVSVLEGYAFGL